MSEILKNKYVQILLAFVLGGILVYFLLPVKVIDREVKVEVVKYVKTKEDIVIVEKGGVKTTTIKRDTATAETGKSVAKEHIEINPRYSTIEIGMMFDKRAYLHAQTIFIQPIVVGIHIDIVPSTKKTQFGLGVGIRF